MLSLNIFAAVLMLFIGIVIGFYFTDKKQGLSFNDVKIASIMFLTLHAILLFMDNLSWIVLLYMIASFFSLFGGILVGEYARIQLARKVVNKTVRKEDIHATIKSFMLHVERVAIYAEEPDELDVHLKEVQAVIDAARNRVKVMKQPEMFARLNHISDACTRMAYMCVTVRGTEDIHHFRAVTERITCLSLDTLEALETSVTQRVSKPMTVMTSAIRISNMK